MKIYTTFCGIANLNAKEDKKLEIVLLQGEIGPPIADTYMVFEHIKAYTVEGSIDGGFDPWPTRNGNTKRTNNLNDNIPAKGVFFIRGDANGDGIVSGNVTDAVYILKYLFGGRPQPVCMESADANDDRTVNLSDAIYLLNYNFLGRPVSAKPFPELSPDPDPGNSLGCQK